MTVLVAGWVAIDEIETPFGKAAGQLGGSATCAALAASLFTDVRLLAAVGEDFPEEFRTLLDRERLDLAGLETVRGAQTSRWGARYGYDMNSRETLYTVLGVNANWTPRLPAGWEGSETVFLAAGAPSLQRRIAEQVTGKRLVMADTIQFFIDNARDELLATFRGVDFVSINESEARQLAETPSIARAARTLLSLGPRGVVVKLGEYGAAFASDGDYFVLPGYPLEEVIDPTGAGDAFAGAFLGFLDAAGELTPSAIRRAIVYGSTVASFQVEGFGPSRLLRLTRAEVEERYRAFRQLTHFEVAE